MITEEQIRLVKRKKAETVVESRSEDRMAKELFSMVQAGDYSRCKALLAKQYAEI